MTDYQLIETQLTVELDLQHRPVAVAFLTDAPSGVEQYDAAQPSGCSFWRIASEGRTFYTVPAHHYNCAIGAYTHHIALPADRAHELERTLRFMTSVGYLRSEDVPAIPRLPVPPGVVVYAPLGATPVTPDVVLFWGPPARIMLLQEAALRAGVTAELHLLARPTCMVLPAAFSHRIVASTGCIGNRVYTGLDESDLYVAIPESDLPHVVREVSIVCAANATLLEYHRGRKRDVAGA